MTARDCKEAILADKELERADIPEGIETVREECFSHGSVKAVLIPASVQKIADSEGNIFEWTKFGAFYDCEKLQKVTFAAETRLKKIG